MELDHIPSAKTLLDCCDSDTAKEAWDAYEAYVGNGCPHAGMDLHNNRVGREVADDPAFTDCVTGLIDALNNGRLRWSSDPAFGGPYESMLPPGECPPTVP